MTTHPTIDYSTPLDADTVRAIARQVEADLRKAAIAETVARATAWYGSELAGDDLLPRP